jgi:uncharacterized protein (TIGR00156 family)
MNLSRNVLLSLKSELLLSILILSVLLFGCSINKNNSESRDNETQLLPYSLQWNESKKHENLENKMVPAVMTGDGKLHRLDSFQGGNFYALKVDVEEGYFSDNRTVPMSVAMARNNPYPNIPVLLRGKIVASLKDNKFFFEDDTGTMVIKINRNLCDNLPEEKSQMIEITGKIVLKYPSNEIEVETVREYNPLKIYDTINFSENRA